MRIPLAALLVVAWMAVCHSVLSDIRQDPALMSENRGWQPGNTDFRKAVGDAGRSIESGVQPTATSSNHFRTAGRRTHNVNQNRSGGPSLPGQCPDKLRLRHAEVILNTKYLPSAVFHDRDYYVIGLRHLII
ncbi:MAG: hypothetical protein LUD76_12240 [Alistipes sp.]|nr:hypothetical protein [Alistipes sp.]